MEQGEPVSIANEFVTIQLYSSSDDAKTGQTWKPTSILAVCLSKRCYFYVGVALTMIGVVMSTAAAGSNQWIVFDDYKQGLTQSNRDKLPTYMGPWQGCTREDDCDRPWRIVPGVGKDDRRLVQFLQGMLVLTELAYLAGAVAICLNLAKTKLTQTSSLFNKLLKVAIPELYTSIAAVLGILTLLSLGLVKQRILPLYGQTLCIGWAFSAFLVAIIITVIGAVLLIFCRHSVPLSPDLTSRPSEHAVDWRRKKERQDSEKSGNRNKWKWRRRFWRRDSIPHTQLEEAEMQVSAVSRGLPDERREGGKGERKTEQEDYKKGKDADHSELSEGENTYDNYTMDDTIEFFGGDELHVATDI